ncbi:PIN domain nuclease [Kribbella pittospori]|uniref:Ribonuclease VapC n=1 Tax=Kribbella pittospori TaxID=722689 RepID=A0A4R0KUK9_9ACTN|nr:PIN domain nuclease [Kribbella pittospori]TCC59755.1 PIN domain nuclease [Kribbella pittospori]
MTPTAESRRWLIDKSALVRLGTCPNRDEWANRINRGLVHIATVTLLEVGFSARSANEHRSALQDPVISAMPVENATPAIERRAVVVQAQLASAGQHRAPSVPDLLIAATAELSGLIVLHVDKDFELIANLTGQRQERLDQD